MTIRSSRHPIGEDEFRIETGNHPGAPVEATTQARRVAGQCVAISSHRASAPRPRPCRARRRSPRSQVAGAAKRWTGGGDRETGATAVTIPPTPTPPIADARERGVRTPSRLLQRGLGTVFEPASRGLRAGTRSSRAASAPRAKQEPTTPLGHRRLADAADVPLRVDEGYYAVVTYSVARPWASRSISSATV